MNNNNITVSLFRVSADSKYLDMIFDCPDTYYFDTLTLEIKYPENNIMRTENYDLSMALFNTKPEDGNTVSKKHWVVRLPLEKINISFPAIYNAYLRASYMYLPYSENTNYGIPVPYKESDGYWMDLTDLKVYDNQDNYVGVKGIHFENCFQFPEPIQDFMRCSDVNLAYKCMLNDLLSMNNLSDPCVAISDEAIRKYLLLYGHQAAMSTGDEEAAERFFKLIVNCFDICGKTCGCCAPKPRNINNCNCGK